MAEYMLVPRERLLVPLGDLDPVEAAPLTDAGLTLYRAIKRSLHLLAPGSTAVVVGVGGLGQMAVQILRAVSPARIVAVDTAEDRLRLAREVGADEAVPSDEAAAETIRELTRGEGAQLVVDCVGADATLALAAAVVGVEGDVAVVGLGGGTLPIRFGALPWEASVALTYWGSQVELMEVLALARAGAIRPHVERFPLDRIEDAYRRMRAGTLEGRAVITPHA